MRQFFIFKLIINNKDKIMNVKNSGILVNYTSLIEQEIHPVKLDAKDKNLEKLLNHCFYVMIKLMQNSGVEAEQWFKRLAHGHFNRTFSFSVEMKQKVFSIFQHIIKQGGFSFTEKCLTENVDNSKFKIVFL